MNLLGVFWKLSSGKKTLLGLAALFVAYLGRDMGWFSDSLVDQIINYGKILTGVGVAHKLDKAKG